MVTGYGAVSNTAVLAVAGILVAILIEFQRNYFAKKQYSMMDNSQRCSLIGVAMPNFWLAC